MLCGRQGEGHNESQNAKLLHQNAKCALHVDPAFRLKEIEVVFALVLTACMGGEEGKKVLGSRIRIIGSDPQSGRKAKLME